MGRLTLALLTVSLLSSISAAQSTSDPRCPAGYSFVGTYCANSSSGDVVLPN